MTASPDRAATDRRSGPPTTSTTPDAVIGLGQLTLAFGRVNRITYHEDGTTPESDTDHTVMLGLIACALANLWYPRLDPGLVAQLALVHDLVEVYAGDTPTLTFDRERAAEKARREADAAERLVREFTDSLPWVPDLIAEYEQRSGPEARFVRAVDKLLPKITHLLNDCTTLIEQGISGSELHDSWRRKSADLSDYAGDFPELLALMDELMDRITVTYTPVAKPD